MEQILLVEVFLWSVSHRFEFSLHDENGASLLSPVDGAETKRDRTFSWSMPGAD